MKKIILGLLILPAFAFAAAPTDEDARALSAAIINRIPSAEKDLKKAVEYGDEDGYAQLQQRPMVKALRAWRDGHEKNAPLFEKYNNCLFAGTDFQFYSMSIFKQTLQADRDKEYRLKAYRDEIKQCKQQLHKK